MANKFGRSYRIVIDPKDGQDPIVVTMPITVQFWIKRNFMESLNYMSIDIYNLSKASRDRIFQDRFNRDQRTVTFEAGYDSLSLVFTGIIFEAGSSRDNTNIITRIEARDGAFDVNTTTTYQTLSKGKTLGDVFDFLMGQFPTLERGARGDYMQVLQRPVTLNGNTYSLLKEYGGKDVFVDNNKVFVMKRNEVIEAGIPELSTRTGLMDAPVRNDGYITAQTLFEPRVTVGQVISLNSKVAPVYNGDYKVLGITHQGIISEAVNGNCRSLFDLWVGSKQFVITEQG